MEISYKALKMMLHQPGLYPPLSSKAALSTSTITMSYDVNCNLLTAKRIRPKRIRPNVVEKETTTKDAKVQR
jgi:hypothetical protein